MWLVIFNPEFFFECQQLGFMQFKEPFVNGHYLTQWLINYLTT